jgi:MFS family permease
VFVDNKMYDGFPARDVRSTGAKRDTIMAARERLCGRGVPLDILAETNGMSEIRKWGIIASVLPVTIVTWGAVLIGFLFLSPAWAKEFSASHGEITLTLVFCQLGQGALAPIGGYSVGKLSIRNLLLIGVCLTAIGLVLVSIATEMWQIILLYALVLAAGAVLTGPLITTTLAARLFTANMGPATAVVISAVAISSFVMPPVMKVMLDAYGWRLMELLIAAFCGCVLVPLIFFVVRESASRVDMAVQERPTTTLLNIRDIARDRVFWGATLAFMPLLFMFNGVYYNIGFNFVDQGNTRTQTAIVLAAVGVASLPGMVICGFLADRFLKVRLFTVTIVAMAIMACVSALFDNYAVLVVTLPIWAFFQGATATLFPIILAKRFGAASFARANGLASPLLSSVIFGTTGASVGRDMLGSYHAAYMMMLFVVPISLAALLLFRAGSSGTRLNEALAPI